MHAAGKALGGQFAQDAEFTAVGSTGAPHDPGLGGYLDRGGSSRQRMGQDTSPTRCRTVVIADGADA